MFFNSTCFRRKCRKSISMKLVSNIDIYAWATHGVVIYRFLPNTQPFYMCTKQQKVCSNTTCVCSIESVEIFGSFYARIRFSIETRSNEMCLFLTLRNTRFSHVLSDIEKQTYCFIVHFYPLLFPISMNNSP